MIVKNSKSTLGNNILQENDFCVRMYEVFKIEDTIKVPKEFFISEVHFVITCSIRQSNSYLNCQLNQIVV